jgi:hypothetical protein
MLANNGLAAATKAVASDPGKAGRLYGEGTMLVRHWLDYDYISLAVLVIGLGAVELLALSI